MTMAEKKAYKSKYNQDRYPGATLTADRMAKAMASENPTKTIKAKIVTNPESVCVGACEAPWIEPISPIPGKHYCWAKFEQTTAKNDLCAEAGGETIYFTYDDFGSWGNSLSKELTEGMLIKIV